jgi:NAD+ synthase (glutamine-hydrolysing)
MAMRTLRVALAQINPTVGDLKGNVSKIIDYIKKSMKSGAQIVAFPELAITGYPPEDLLLKNKFIEDNIDALKKIQMTVGDITAIVGYVDKKDDIYNAAALLHKKRLIDTYHKIFLPNYGVFDEYRYFKPGTRSPIYRVGDTWIGINICEDIWFPEGPALSQTMEGAEVIININASPYSIGKNKLKERMLSSRASNNAAIVAYLNTVGGQDELVFDGHSLIFNQDGVVIARGKQFEEDLLIVDLDLDGVKLKKARASRKSQKAIKYEKKLVDKIAIPVKKSLMKGTVKSRIRHPSQNIQCMDSLQEIYSALTLGTADYVRKNGFKSVVIGLSGGADSSLVASLAVDALGKKNVVGLLMPSPYTSRESTEDVYGLAKYLGIKLIEFPINTIFTSYLNSFKTPFKGLPADVTEENLQARIRGNVLMAFSNKRGWLVLTTGNKSEMSVGYATLYGDMAGGFAVLKDVPKTMVYKLIKWRNKKKKRPVIPARVIRKAPTAELRPGQKDSDTLPPYHVLDLILKAYIEEDKSFKEILSLGFDAECIRNVILMVDMSEYKRRQAPPGVKITQRAFGRDRRFPITNKYRGY